MEWQRLGPTEWKFITMKYSIMFNPFRCANENTWCAEVIKFPDGEDE